MTFEQSILIRAGAAELFALTQDYVHRLAWDPFLKTAELLHGATAAAIGWALTIIVSATAKLAAGKGVPVMASLLLGVWSVSIGLIGGYVTFRRELREQASP